MNNNYTKVIFVLETISQPRCFKRINGFLSKGFDVEVHGFDRGKYGINAEESGVPINILGNHEDGGGYIRKLVSTFQSIKHLVSLESSKGALFYGFGFPITMALKLSGCKNYVYEISDILYGYPKFDAVRWILVRVDRYLVRHSRLSVLTSEGFVNFLFNVKRPSNIIVQPNKLSSSFVNKIRPPKKVPKFIDQLKFAYVGAFRYPNTVFRFAEIVGQKFPNHEFHFYGDSILTGEVKEIAEQYENVFYHGAFKSPDDLEGIYEKIDVVVACYDVEGLNERMAEPNKLYEAMYFKKPIVVSEGTFLSRKVREMNCGYTIDASNDDSVVIFLNSLNEKTLKSVRDSIDLIEERECVDDDGKALFSLLDK